MKHCNMLAGEVVESSSLGVFKRCVVVVLRNIICGGLGSVGLVVSLTVLKCLFQPR